MSKSQNFWSRSADPNDPINRRRAGRLVCNDLKCTLGVVLDVSVRGLRVITRQDPEFLRGRIFEIAIESMGQVMKLPAKLVWVKKNGRQYECGIETVAMGPGKQQALRELAHLGADQELLRPRGA